MRTLLICAGFLLLAPALWGQKMSNPSFDLSSVAYEQRIPSTPVSSVNKSLTRPLISAHRGGRFIAGYPENALETFQFITKQAPVIVECDVNMSVDSILFLLHDNTLNRTTTGCGPAQETLWSEIHHLFLKDDYGTVTRYHPPSLEEVLHWAGRGHQLTLDVKRGVPIEKVVETVRNMGAIDYASVITYNYEDALRAYLEDPRIRISVNIRNELELKRYTDGPFNHKNLMAFTGLTERPASFYRQLKDAGITVIVGTIGNLDQSATAKGDRVYHQLFKAGADILATDRPLAVHKAFTD
ncbi:glycerophosphodiester phosphodiesterase family protein [Phaeodactylibacter sp.]|uniref:glycerophosphodiester phosphodiesterase family protein n=1 Tax=Phaeodactylibacter sp. TaxID=1940289 RepID=UPI0025E373A7|nr:glycerophosphodiester phosphodiesterase family protein [Phaeodactylibacter sp.]MCI4650704.1 glycerophosphodiester phosphodiesterase family protein [Phaeodactylibacter sp.]MCI5089934.1 glycerophosphodiester phosphodiesterase family protein [Phaeodactylibacter sp.]